MKILVISEYWTPAIQGGGEKSAELLIGALVKDGLEVHVLTSYFKGLKIYEEKGKLVIHRLLKTGKSPRAFFSNLKREFIFPNSVKKQTKKLLKQHNFDVIHYFNINSSYGVIKTNIPKVIHINSPVLFSPTAILENEEDIENFTTYKRFKEYLKQSKNLGKVNGNNILYSNPIVSYYLYKRYLKNIKNLNNFNYYTPISTFMKNLLIKSGVSEDKISVIPNIVETDNFRINKKNEKELDIIYIGEYTEAKGLFVILDSLKLLKREYRCNFYGDGLAKDKVINFVKENDLNVKVNGWIDYSSLPEILSDKNILLFPSLITEGFGRTIIEAQASGVFPVASKIGGTTDAIPNNKGGKLFAPGNYKELAKILENINLKKIDKEALVEEAKKYNGKSISKKLIKIYENLKK